MSKKINGVELPEVDNTPKGNETIPESHSEKNNMYFKKPYDISGICCDGKIKKKLTKRGNEL